MTGNNFYSSLFPNVSITLKSLLTLSISVTIEECSFYKCKFIKTNLLLIMPQSWSLGLGLITFESQIGKSIDPKSSVHEARCTKARKFTKDTNC